MVRIEAIVGAAAFAALEPEWNALLSASGASNIFLTWDWISLWWAVYGRDSRLNILVARDGAGTLVGIAPLKRRSLGILGLDLVQVSEFIGVGGDVTPERLDFIVRRGHEAEVAGGMVDALCRDRTLAGIDLRPFAAESSNLPSIMDAFHRNGRRLLRADKDSVCPIVRLPPTWDEFLRTRSRNYRKKLGEYERRCARDFRATVRVSSSEAEVLRDMEVLRVLHIRRWGNASRAFRSSEYLAFHLQLAQRLFSRGSLRLFVLESDTTPLAALYCFAVDGRYYYYQAGRDPDRSRHRPGLVLLHAAIRHAIAEGVGVFDFLTGSEAYKYIWAGEEQDSVRLTAWRTRPIQAIGRLARFLDQAKQSRPAWARARGASEPGADG